MVKLGSATFGAVRVRVRVAASMVAVVPVMATVKVSDCGGLTSLLVNVALTIPFASIGRETQSVLEALMMLMPQHRCVCGLIGVTLSPNAKDVTAPP